MEKKSIISDRKPIFQTPANVVNPNVGWNVDRFEELIYAHGYDAYIDRALRCPCCDKISGQAQSTCLNCLGRGWFFIDRRETRIIAQSMNNVKKFQDWSELNHGTAKITARGSDKMGFMDRIILLQLEAYYSEILRPVLYKGEIFAYPVYEPLEITNIFLFVDDVSNLKPLTPEMYRIEGNRIIFDLGIQDFVVNEDFTTMSSVPINISIRYSYYPVYHVLDANRELMKVRERNCSFTDEQLRAMPINVTCRKAHFIFDAQKFGAELNNNNIST